MSRLTGRRTVVLLTLVGALLVLLAGTRTWATVTVSGTLPGLSELIVPGRRAAPGAIAVALAAAAGAVVLATAARVVRFVVAAGLVVAGAVVILIGVRGARDEDAAVAVALRDSLHVSADQADSGAALGAGAAEVAITLWPAVVAAGGGVLVLAGVLALLGGRSWSGPSRRYERAPAPTARVPENAGTTWDALSRGEDPTSLPDERT